MSWKIECLVYNNNILQYHFNGLYFIVGKSIMSPTMCQLLPAPIEREQVGICKQSMLQLRHQLRQYMQQLHAEYVQAEVDPVIHTAAKEVCNVKNNNISS